MARISHRSRLHRARDPALPELASRLVDLAHEAVGDPIEALLFGATGLERIAYPRILRNVQALRAHLDHREPAVRAATALLLGVLHQPGRPDREALASRLTRESDAGVRAIVWLAWCRALRSQREVLRARHVKYGHVALMAEGPGSGFLSPQQRAIVARIDRALMPPKVVTDAGLDALGRGIFSFPDPHRDEALEELARDDRRLASFPLAGGSVGAVARAFLRGPGDAIRATYPLPFDALGPPSEQSDPPAEEPLAADVPLHPDFADLPDPAGLEHPVPLRTIRGRVRFRPPGLLDVPWETLDDCYGKAVHTPRMVLAFTTGGAEDQAEARWYFHSSLLHQGTSSPATARVVPFLVDLLEQPSLGVEAQMLDLVDWAVCSNRPQDGPAACRDRAYAELNRCAERLHPFLDHPDVEVRRLAAKIVGRLTQGASVALPRLLRRLEVEDHPIARLTALVAMGWCAHIVGDDAALQRLAAAIDDRDEHPITRSTAAIIVLEVLPTGSDHAALAPARAHAERRRTRPLVRDPFFGRWYDHLLALYNGLFRHYDVERLLTEADNPDHWYELRDAARYHALNRLFPEVRPQRPWRAGDLSVHQRRVLKLVLDATPRGHYLPHHLWRGLPHTYETLSAWLGLQPSCIGDRPVTIGRDSWPLFQAVRLVLDGALAEDALAEALTDWAPEAWVEAAMELPTNRYGLWWPTHRDDREVGDDGVRNPRPRDQADVLVLLLGRLLHAHWARVSATVHAQIDATLAAPAAAPGRDDPRWLLPLLLAWRAAMTDGRTPADERIAVALALVGSGPTRWSENACLRLVREHFGTG